MPRRRTRRTTSGDRAYTNRNVVVPLRYHPTRNRYNVHTDYYFENARRPLNITIRPNLQRFPDYSLADHINSMIDVLRIGTKN